MAETGSRLGPAVPAVVAADAVCVWADDDDGVDAAVGD